MSTYPEIMEQLLLLLEKLSASTVFAELLRSHRVVKNVVALSKEAILDNKMKKSVQIIMKNLNGRGGNNNRSKNSLGHTS